MRFFHLSDLHIGLKLFNRDLSEDQAYILNQIAECAARERPDAVVIAGDVYDRAVPSAEAVALFDRFVRALTDAVPEAAVMIVSGNHDSAPRMNLFRGLLSRQNVHMIGLPPETADAFIEKVALRDEYGSVNFYLLPFVRPSMVRRAVCAEGDEPALSYDETLRRLIARENIDPQARNVIVSHQFYLPMGTRAEDVERMDSEICTVGNIDAVGADVLAPFDYAALGHIHKPMTLGAPALRYCGTPLAASVSEAGQQKGIVLVEMGAKGALDVRVLPLEPLRQVRALQGDLDDLLREACDDYVRVTLTGDAGQDAMDVRDRLRAAFPHLLEIVRAPLQQAELAQAEDAQAELDPFELCLSFLKDADDDARALLRDVINTVREEAQP